MARQGPTTWWPRLRRWSGAAIPADRAKPKGMEGKDVSRSVQQSQHGSLVGTLRD